MTAAAIVWTCDLHRITTTGDCPKCDDDMLALHSTEAELRVAIAAAAISIEKAGRHLATLLAAPAHLLDDRVHTTAHDAQNALAAARALLDEATR